MGATLLAAACSIWRRWCFSFCSSLGSAASIVTSRQPMALSSCLRSIQLLPGLSPAGACRCQPIPEHQLPQVTTHESGSHRSSGERGDAQGGRRVRPQPWQHGHQLRAQKQRQDVQPDGVHQQCQRQQLKIAGEQQDQHRGGGDQQLGSGDLRHRGLPKGGDTAVGAGGGASMAGLMLRQPSGYCLGVPAEARP